MVSLLAKLRLKSPMMVVGGDSEDGFFLFLHLNLRAILSLRRLNLLLFSTFGSSFVSSFFSSSGLFSTTTQDDELSGFSRDL